MIACYLFKKQFISFKDYNLCFYLTCLQTVFEPKPHLISNVVMNVRRVWASSNSLENMTITRLLVFLTLSFYLCLMIED